MDLTDKQITIWRELGSQLSAPPDLCQQALTFYSHYRLQDNWPIDKAALVFRVAYFLSQKAQVLYDNQGNRLKGIAISANAILRDHPRHEEFLYHLKQMIRTVPMPPNSEHLQEEVAYFSRHLSFSLAFLNKLRSTLKRIRISQKWQPPADYQQQLQRFLWLLFIDCKAQQKMSTDIIESTCLMSCVFVHLLMEKYRQQGIFSIYFEQDGEGCTLSNEEVELIPFMQSYFHIKDLFTYKRINAYFIKYLEALSRNIQWKRPFSHSSIQKNIYILQKLYSKRLNDDLLDQSTFLRGNSSQTNIPVRMTPFGRKPLLAPRNIPALSHKILTYDINEQENKSELSNRGKDDKSNFSILSKLKMQQTPKTMLIRATPMSQAMEMYNWLYEKKNRYGIKHQEKENIHQMLLLCGKSENEEFNQSNAELVAGLWGEVQQKCELQPLPALPLLLLSAHMTLHILNVPLSDISTPMKNLGICELQLWQSLDTFLNFDKTMPLGLRLHLLSMQTSFITSRLWKSEELVQVIAQEYQQSSHRLFKRLMHQSAFQIHFLCRRLNLQEAIQDISYLILKESLKNEEKLLFDRSLQQLILCSIYAATKVNDLALRFNEILSVCREVLGLSVPNYQELIDRVRIGEKRDNIIMFYNMIFVPALKGYLKLLRNTPLQELSSFAKVREIISKESMNLAKSAQIASPQMATYFAYSQSPILRPKLKDVSNTIRRDHHYNLQDIQTKFGRFAGSTLKQTRKTKH